VYGPRGNFGGKVVVERLPEMRLHWEWSIQELSIEILLRCMHQYHGDSAIIELRTASTSDHLQHICYREILVSPALTVEELGPFHNNEVGGQVDAPGQCGCAYQN